MDLTTHKLLAAIGLTLAAIFAFAPRSTAAAAPASAPPKSGLQMHWFHSQAGVRSLQSRESRFGSKAVIGLESMLDLASLKSTYRFEHVQAVPALHAAVVTLDDPQLHDLLASAPADPRVRYVSPPGPTRHVLNLPSDPLLQSVDPITPSPVRVAVRVGSPRAGARPHAGRRKRQGRGHRHRRRHRPGPQRQGRRPLRGQPLRDAAFDVVRRQR